MEPTKIESTAELDLTRADESAKAIVSLIAGIQFTPPDDAPGNNARLRDIALRMDALAEALKITPPSGDLQAKIARHREVEHRHREQRTQICALLQTPWDQVAPRVKAMLDDSMNIREAIARAGHPVENGPLALAVRELLVDHGQLVAIHDELKAAGVIDDQADPTLPIAGVRLLIRERRELLEEMAKAVEPEKIVDALSSPPPAPEEPSPEEPEAVASFMRGDDALPDILPGAVRLAHDALVAVITASERDWSKSADLAWIYGVLVGWSEDDLEVLQISFGWRDPVVQIIDQHRAALVCAGMSEQ